MISLKEVKKLAVQSRLEFSDGELETMRSELEAAIKDIDRLTELITDNVEINYPQSLDADQLREDIVVPSMDRGVLLSNAPEHTDNAFLVPNVVE